MGSVRDIARRAKVSITTVSRVLNNHPEISPRTREKVLSVAHEAGYVAGGAKRTGTTLGLVFTGEMYWSEYDAALMRGILRGANERKYDVLVVNLPRDKADRETYTQFLTRKGLRGAILRTSERSHEICQEIAKEGFPSVVVADRFEGSAVNYISYNSGPDSQRAIEHLIHLGHQRIAVASSHDPDRDHLDRLEGYKRALAAHGLEPDASLMIQIRPDLSGGANAINRLMSLPNPPSAVFFADPPAAAGAMRRIHELGLRVPEDLSIVGFDDASERFRLFPVLTAVCQDASKLGFEAANWLTSYVTDNAEAPFQKVASTLFEINQSTGVPTKSPLRILPDGTRISLEATEVLG